MVKASSGTRRGTRRKFKCHFKSKFKTESYLKEFKEHDRIIIRPLSSSQSGFPHARFRGKEGMVIRKQGNSFIIKVKIGNKEKQIIIPPEHLVKKV